MMDPKLIAVGISPRGYAALQARGVVTAVQLSDLLHGSEASRAAVAQLLELSAEEMTALRQRIDVVVPAANPQLGSFGVRPRPTKRSTRP